MANEWRKTYDISGGDVIIRLLDVEKKDNILSVQVDTDVSFDGNNTRVRLLQSNKKTLDITKWHPLPEGYITMPIGADSTLLNTLSFTAKFAAIEIDAGNASAGILEFIAQYTK